MVSHSQLTTAGLTTTEPNHRLRSYTQMSSVAEPSIGSLIGSLDAEWQLVQWCWGSEFSSPGTIGYSTINNGGLFISTTDYLHASLLSTPPSPPSPPLPPLKLSFCLQAAYQGSSRWLCHAGHLGVTTKSVTLRTLTLVPWGRCILWSQLPEIIHWAA